VVVILESKNIIVVCICEHGQFLIILHGLIFMLTLYVCIDSVILTSIFFLNSQQNEIKELLSYICVTV